MCKFVSAILLENGDLFCNPEHTDSHEELIRAHCLRDGPAQYDRFARIEFLPGADWCDLEQWSLHVDRSMRPDWLTDEMQEATERQLIARVRRMIVTDKRDVLLGGCWIFGPGGSARAVMRGRIAYVHPDADLTRANLTGVDLHEADLHGANLYRVNFTGAVLTRADLTEADLTWACLTRADLTEADLTRANLTRAYFIGADLAWANLHGTDLTRANFTWADLALADLPAGWRFADSALRRSGGGS